MYKEVTIYAEEREIVELINKHFSKQYDSIVAAEELSNQAWCVNVTEMDCWDNKILTQISKDDFTSMLFKTRTILNYLCSKGYLEAGSYVIDCTW